MKALISVNKRQNAYSVIGDYISIHTTTIENIIAVIQMNDVIIKELFMVSDNGDDFYWENDWWEGEDYVSLLDFFPVKDARKSEIEEYDITEWCRKRNLLLITRELYLEMKKEVQNGI